MENVTFKLAGAYGDHREGDVITAALLPADVHVAEELATYLAGYKPFDNRADEISPPILVDNDTDLYRTFSSDDAFEKVPVKSGLLAPPKFVDVRSSTAQYTVVQRVVGSLISPITEKQTKALYSIRQAAMRRCMDIIMLDREADVLAQVTLNTSFASNNRKALGAGFNWNGGANSDPMKDLQDRIVVSAQRVTGIGMNQVDAFAFLRHPSVRDHMRQMLGDGPAAAVAGGADSDFQIPGLPPIHVFSAKAKTTSTGNIDYIWPTGTVVLYSLPPGMPVDGQTISTFKTFRRRGPAGVGFTTREYFDPRFGPEGATVVVVSMADIAVVTSNIAGGTISGTNA